MSAIMSKLKKGGNSTERMLVGVGLVMFLLLIVVIIYALQFLSHNILSAFLPAEGGAGEIKFDLEGFKNLGL
jgi:uncharacterized membrane protein